MNDELETLEMGALRCVEVGFPGEYRFLCLPGEPRLDGDGLHLASTGDGYRLSLQMSWGPTANVVEAARRQLQGRFPGEDVELLPAELDDVKATLVLVDDAGVRRDLGPFAASGTPANRLALVESIPPEDTKAVQAAMGGAAGRFHVRCEGRLRIDALAKAEVAGSLQPVYAALVPPLPTRPPGWFPFARKPQKSEPAPPTPEDVRRAVDEELARGRLTLDVRRTAQFPDEGLCKATEPLLDNIVQQVLGNWSNAAHAASTAPEHLQMRASRMVQERREWRIDATADVAAMRPS